MKLPIVDHPDAARDFVNNDERSHWHDKALWFVRSKRDRQAHSIPEWEYLRELASQIKTHTIANLDRYLQDFERNATAMGAVVHWAADAEEHNRIVLDILKRHDVLRIIKSKSMLTEECGLNHYLEDNGIDVVDTDLGERIVQLRGETPSHIVLPAIHIKKEEVGETFHEHLGTDEGASDPQYLTEAARGHLRGKFLAGEVGITGVNFGIAESGGFVVCTNEGNADLGASLPRVHIACMGIEKLIPRQQDLAVFTRLLARSATGQPITSYTSHFHGPRDANSELHIVLVDNGRSKLRQSKAFRDALHCIRCGACMNTCPVYRRSGGHSYRATVPGPIGSVLSPTRDDKRHKSLPYACSLCGSCTDVCPVKIPLHHQLLAWRGELVGRKLVPLNKRWSMKAASLLFRHPRMFALMGKAGRTALRVLPRFATHNRFNTWTIARELPEPPRESFRDWYRQNRKPPK
ncbi:lactate utilization protein [Rubripirellula amarantea]|uniref:Lactate utilization protein B n=1 Tax=Rubripirellula amarantea TaxID=2527999 RepID=A0A5C5WF56_9BACT|nr:lactate utilization protein B [Rubripirellula amarantea]MDA8743241.1 lactate utilization protein [Rubripirellula amarantea]TWT49506.1 Lactate utilization protein B [Rubripirellula amarantea]